MRRRSIAAIALTFADRITDAITRSSLLHLSYKLTRSVDERELVALSIHTASVVMVRAQIALRFDDQNLDFGAVDSDIQRILDGMLLILDLLTYEEIPLNERGQWRWFLQLCPMAARINDEEDRSWHPRLT